MEWARSFRQNSLFLKIVFEKAYDCIAWHFLIVVLQALDFGPNFLASINLLYRDVVAVLTINNTHSLAIGIFCSVRQGCPLAPSLYVLAAETFGYQLAQKVFNEFVEGIILPSNQGQLVNGHFVDDLFLTLCEDEQSVS